MAMAPMSTRHHRRLLGTNKSLPQGCLSHRLSHPIPLPLICITLNLPSLLRSKHRRSPHPLGPLHHPFPTQPLSCQHAPLLSHRPSRQADPRPIPSMPLATLRRHRLRQAAQNQKPTSAQRVFLRLSTRRRPNLANPRLVPLNDHALCPCLAIPRMAARTRSAASRRSPPVPSAASCRARRRLQGLLAPKGRITGVRSHPL